MLLTVPISAAKNIPAPDVFHASEAAATIQHGFSKCQLSVVELAVLEMRFGLNRHGWGGETCTLDEISKYLCLTRDQIQHIEQNALHKLRRKLDSASPIKRAGTAP
jgi:DNA-directed RNA polymerase sigma subunit (sigma70/sigma32)